jgi:formamidopyrimidine-DNA glycosylase
MPELPEVEVVRRGLARWVAGRTVAAVEVAHPRAVRRHPGGGGDFAARLRGRTLTGASRRGKYLWLPTAGPGGRPDEAVLAHLGMSGQLLVRPAESPDETHLRVRLAFTDDGPELRFVDQRTFGGLAVVDLVDGVPEPVAHIGRDPLDPDFDDAAWVAALRRRRTGLKRALLDQSLASGIGNIYADEALGRARLHCHRAPDTLRPT